MAYSNINKDKAQVKRNLSMVSLIVIIVGLIFTISSLHNIWGQYSLLKTAQSNLEEISDKIDLLEKDNLKLEEKIKYATTSMGMRRNRAIYYGVGGKDDYWINLPASGKDIEFEMETPETRTSEENWVKWWRLFTHLRPD